MKPGRNDPCPCGSGMKYKKCCESKTARLSAPSGNSPSLVERALQFHRQGNLEQAEILYREVLRVEPDNADALHLCGVVAYQKGCIEKAEELIREAIAIYPRNAEFYNNLGNILQDQGRLDESVVCYRQAISIKPDYPEAYNNLGTIMREMYLFEESLECYKKALSYRADYPEAYNNLGNLFKEMNIPSDAVCHYDEALRLRPDYHAARYHRSLALLQKGDYTQGWRDYEWRWYVSKDAIGWKRDFYQPQWQGEDIRGRTILLHSEQGFGDAIQAVRYAPILAEHGSRVIVECRSELKRLFGTLAGVEAVVDRSEPLPDFDVHCPLMSLPFACGTILETIPSRVPYLRAPHDLVSRWAERFCRVSQFKVGLAWGGSSRNLENRKRSLPVTDMAPLAGAADVRWYSLQKGETTDQIERFELTGWTEELYDFADTAALIAHLDLVISVDTSIAHLAGALGKPVWLLSKYGSDWRWLLDREDSPWYPTMRIFRQQEPGNWREVVERVADALATHQATCCREVV